MHVFTHLLAVLHDRVEVIRSPQVICLLNLEVIFHSCLWRQEHQNGPDGHLKGPGRNLKPVCGCTNLVRCFRSEFARTSLCQSALVHDGSQEHGEPRAAPRPGTNSHWPSGTRPACLLDGRRRTSSLHPHTQIIFLLLKFLDRVTHIHYCCTVASLCMCVCV